jgi:hypothetical protein
MSRQTIATTALIAAGCTLWWIGATFLKAPPPTPPSSTTEGIGTSPPAPVPGSLDGSDTETCLTALRQPREVRVEVQTSAGQPVQSFGSPSFHTHGKLDAETKASVRKLQQEVFHADTRRLQEAREKGDLRKEAELAEWVAIHDAMSRMLEDDTYLTLDIGAVDKLWPRRLPGWYIVESREVKMTGGIEAMLVYCIKRNADPKLAAAAETKKQMEWFLAEEQAFHFNAQSDEVRRATIEAWDRRDSLKGGTLPEADVKLIRSVSAAMVFGAEIDRQRLTLRVRAP